MSSENELIVAGTDRPSRRHLTSVPVFLVGVLSIVLLLWTHRTSERQNTGHFELEAAIADVELTVATSHLWLEEFLTEDPEVRIDERLAELEVSDDLMLGVIERLGEPGLRQKAEAVRDRLTEFRRLSVERRYLGGESAGVGSELDQGYDNVFYELMTASQELHRTLEERWSRQQAQARLRLGAIVAAWALIVTLAGIGLWTREKHRQKADDALRESQKWLATTLTSIGDAVVTTDLLGSVTFMNPTAESLTGWPAVEAQGRPIEEIFRIAEEGDDRPVANPVLEVVRGRPAGLTNHTQLLGREGSRHYISHSAAPIRVDPSTLLGVVLVFRDMTRRKKAEKALLAREAELREAQKMEAVGRLAGGLAHDINNYLGAIRGYCEVAKMKGESGPALERRMDDAIETTRNVSSLISQLLAFSRRQPVEPEVVDLNHVVRGLESMMQRLIGEDVRLKTRLAADLWPIEIDPSQVEQILVNLLVNARDALPNGGRILIETRNVAAEETEVHRHPASVSAHHALLLVSDTGIGMTPEVREKIFEPFFTTKEGEHSGLGLATIYGIVQQNGGFIVVESEPGQGTTFEIFLPSCDAELKIARRESEAPAPRGPEAEPAPAPERASLEGLLKVLLVEDNEAMRRSTRDMLEALGYEVRVASDGEEALRRLVEENEPADVVITDVVMPGISGKELVDRLQASRPGVRCLFISGYTDQVMGQHGLSEDRVDFLAKPFGVRQLARKIDEMVGT